MDTARSESGIQRSGEEIEVLYCTYATRTTKLRSDRDRSDLRTTPELLRVRVVRVYPPSTLSTTIRTKILYCTVLYMQTCSTVLYCTVPWNS